VLLAAVKGDSAVFSGVRLRLPDIVFEESLRIDLGGRVVELHHFGHGNTPGDTVVYEPKTKAAWTGNLILGGGTIPWAIEGKASAYLRTISRLAAGLDVKTIVPGHTVMTSADILSRYLRYLSGLIDSVRSSVRSGRSLEQTLAETPLGETYLPPADSPFGPARPVFVGFHRWNVKKTYQEMNGR